MEDNKALDVTTMWELILTEEVTSSSYLAYMEPLCTVPEYRHKGIAAASLSEVYRRMKHLCATHMTGGGNPFYSAIGYEPSIIWTYWRKS